MLPLDIPIQLSREEAQRLAAQELGKLRYGLELPPAILALQERLERWLRVLLEAIFGASPESGGGGVNTWFIVILVTVLVLGVALVVWRVGLPRLNRQRVAGRVDADSTISAEQYRSLAEAAAAREDWRTAVRERFRSLVRALEARTILDPRASRTALEVANLAGRLMPGHREDLFAAAAVFGDVEYGDTVATAEHYTQLTALETSIVSGADKVDFAAAEAGLGR